VPAEVHVCAPCWPVGQAHATLAPGTHAAGALASGDVLGAEHTHAANVPAEVQVWAPV